MQVVLYTAFIQLKYRKNSRLNWMWFIY
jgi:hypothetical protein